MSWDHDQPAVVYLREQITQFFPQVALHWAAMTNVDPKNAHKPRVNENNPQHGVGGYNVKLKESGDLSDHSFGRAADIYVKIQNPLLKAIGDSLFAAFIANARQLGIDDVIWNRQIWSLAHPAIRPYPGHKHHEDHIHVSFTVHGSQLRPPILVTVLQQVRTAIDAQFPLPSIKIP
jgi:hypothetical protein